MTDGDLLRRALRGFRGTLRFGSDDYTAFSTGFSHGYTRSPGEPGFRCRVHAGQVPWLSRPPVKRNERETNILGCYPVVVSWHQKILLLLIMPAQLRPMYSVNISASWRADSTLLEEFSKLSKKSYAVAGEFN